MKRLIPRLFNPSASVARERQEHLLEHHRNLVGCDDLVAILREEIYALVGRHGGIDINSVQFMETRGSNASTLTVDIEVPFNGRYCA
jgi:cell division topological specificity factor